MKTGDPLVLKSFISGAVTGLLGFVVAIMGPLAPTNALSVDTARDCDSNAVVYCGATTTKELHHKYNQSQDVQAIYTHFGISESDISHLTNIAVAGSVTSSGRVVVNGETVATDAVTAGRQDMRGSTTMTSGGVTFFERPPSASFQQSSLPAYVVMKDGQFDFAIIASCGNPVKATPVPKPAPEQPAPAPTPTPTPPAATPPAPVSTASSNSSSSSSSAATATVTVTQPQITTPTPVAPVTTPVTVVATQPASLPKTGVSGLVSVTVLAAIAGTTIHLLYARYRNRFASTDII